MSDTVRKVLRMLCLGLGVLFLPGTSRAAAAEAGQNCGTMTACVYSYASEDSAVIGQLENQTRITVLGMRKDFYEIDCYGMTGFIAQEQVACHKDECYVNCKSGSAHTRYMPHRQLMAALQLRHSLRKLAQMQLGTPYVYGGAQPGGFDCSGLTYYLYSMNGITIHRTASQQLQDGMIVAKEGLQIGDLVFFREPDEITAASHVGIYVGDNQMIHAGSSGIAYADLDDLFQLFSEQKSGSVAGC